MRRIGSLRAASAIALCAVLHASSVGAQSSGSCPSPSGGSGGGATYNGTTNDYFNAVSTAESSNKPGIVNKYGFMGLYQMGGPALVQAGFASSSSGNGNIQWNGTDGIYSTQQFLSNPQAQQDAFYNYEQGNWQQIQSKGLTKYVGQTINGTTITNSGLLMGSQFGVGNLSKYLNSGGNCAAGADGSGTCVGSWIAKGNGFDVSSITGQQEPGISSSTASSDPNSTLVGGDNPPSSSSTDAGAGPSTTNPNDPNSTLVGGEGSSSGDTTANNGSNSNSNSNCNNGGTTDMTSKACQATMPMIQAINCSNFPAQIQGFCNQYKPYLMTQQGCQDAEKWAEDQVKSGGGGSDQQPQPQQQQAVNHDTGGGGSDGLDWQFIFGPNSVNNGDDGMPNSSGGDSSPISPDPNTAVGGGPGGTPNESVPQQPTSGGPVPVGKIKPGQWAEACKKQTKYDGQSVWSYVLWCSQLKSDPPRRNSGTGPGISNNIGYSGPGSLSGGGSGGTLGGVGAMSSTNGTSDGSSVQDPTRSSNTVDRATDDQCYQKLKAAGADIHLEGYNYARQVIPQGVCGVKVSLIVKKWSTASQASPVPHINCTEAYAVDQWVKALGVSSVAHMGAYSCRGMRGGPGSNGNHISYHGYGDAFDVKSMNGVAFVGSQSGIEGQAHKLACSMFDRVLSSAYYRGTYTHFHVEMNHGKGRCQ